MLQHHKTNRTTRGLIVTVLSLAALTAQAQPTSPVNGQLWPDTDGQHINAHGGNIIRHEGTWYWYGEHRPVRGFSMDAGVAAYSSSDLIHWKNEGVVLSVSHEPGSDIESGCIMERPKVIYNKKTKKFVMLFHLELKGQGYATARVAFAVSDSPTGPFRFIRSTRLHAGKWPFDMNRKAIEAARQTNPSAWKEWWTPEWRREVEKGMYLWQDFEKGQMSRDMTVYVDDDGHAYHITSSQENLTLLVSELTDDYLDFTGRYNMIAPGGQNEAPCIFRRGKDYWLICSGCTGWAPNEARMFHSRSIWGPWQQLPSPFVGTATGYQDMPANKTFGAQGTYILPLGDQWMFMADIWNPRRLAQSLHPWLPIQFDDKGTPVIKWVDVPPIPSSLL